MGNNTWYYDIEQKAYIEAVFDDGRFVDSATKRPIILKEGTRVRIATSIHGVRDKEEEKSHKEIKRELLLRKGAEVDFSFYYSGKSYEFKVILLDDLFLLKKGNQHSKSSLCKCVVYKPNEKYIKDFEADSLNQAFIKASVKYRPSSRSHACNIFKTFFYKGRRLEDLRTL